MKNINFMRFETWCIDAHILDEAKVDMDETVRDAVEEMQEMAFWRIFPELKAKYDGMKGTYFNALDYTKDYIFGKDTAHDIDWDKKEIESLEQFYIWLRAKCWHHEQGLIN